MIRLIQRRLIIPRGDTGTFTVPLLATAQTGDASVFTIFDQKTQKKVFEKIVNINGDALEIVFSHADTVNLPVGDYVWDIKFYKDPVIIDNVLVDGTEIDSYYAAFKLPVCEIRQTGDTLLIADDAPTSTIAPDQLNIILAATDEINAAKREVMNTAEVVEANTQTASDAATSATADAARAETAAEAASTSASAASQSAADADSAKDSAIAANTAAQQALLDANSAATTATTKATEASTSATAASNSASAASSSATNAATSASNAAASVTEMEALVRAIPTNVSEFENDAGYITDDDVPVKDVQVDGVSVLTNGVANVPIGGNASFGVVKTNPNRGTAVSPSFDNDLCIAAAPVGNIQLGNDIFRPIVPARQHVATFYGLAKVAGVDLALSNNPVGTYTNEAKQAIQTMLDVPSNADIPTAISELDNDANYATEQYVNNTFEENDKHFIVHFTTNDSVSATCDKTIDEIQAAINDGKILIGYIAEGPTEIILFGMPYVAEMIMFTNNLMSSSIILLGVKQDNTDTWQMATNVFLSADANISNSYNAGSRKISGVGDPATSFDAANKRYVDNAIANVNTMKIHICTAAEYNAQTGVPTIVNPDTQTFYLVPGGEGNNLFIEWAYVNSAWERFGSADVDLSNYVQKTDYATQTTGGVVKVINSGGGVQIDQGYLVISPAADSSIKAGSVSVLTPIVPGNQHASAFYGLAKAAGDSTQSASSNAVGTYTDEAKAAIQQMLDVPSNSDMSAYATKTDTVLETTLSRGRKANTTIGEGSFAFGNDVEASGENSYAFGVNATAAGNCSFAEGRISVANGNYSHSEGVQTTASGDASHVEGSVNTASGMISHAEGNGSRASGAVTHAEGYYTTASGSNSHSEGNKTVTSGSASHAEGFYTIANGYATRASGMFNIEQQIYPNWVAGTTYSVGDKVTYNEMGVECKVANSDESFQYNKWIFHYRNSNYVNIVGNGSLTARSNAYALTWTGDGHYAGDVYVHSNADSTGGTKLATVTDLNNAIGDLIAIQPTQPTDPDTKIWIDDDASGSVQVPTVSEMESALATKVSDVQVNGVSVVTNGVAEIPLANSNGPGIAYFGSQNGLSIDSQGVVSISYATANQIKTGTNLLKPIVPASQSIATFYGLATAAGDSTQKASSNAVGTYTDAAKTAIKNMIGVEEGLKVVRLI